ncbi:MAG: hypothetical protein DSZ28_08295 [Thiothrix sp.]|nr:MAG: hypothetical protein DSZ28_08295 [Thiothrix sp.]
MEEDEFRSTYQQFNTIRCPFEKALNARRCDCSQSKRFLLAGRDGVGCQSKNFQTDCLALLTIMRGKAQFVLHLTKVDGPLPHNKEIRVQVGGLQGLQRLLNPDQKEEKCVDNVSLIVSAACEKFGSFDDLPFEQLLKSILAFEGRKKR